MNLLKLNLFLLLAVLVGGCSSMVSYPIVTVASFQGDYFSIKEVDVPPQVRSQAGPNYPYSLKKAGRTGKAVVEFIVGPAGEPVQIQCSAANHPAFAQAACEAVAQWRFRPALKNGRIVPCRLSVPIEFTLAN